MRPEASVLLKAGAHRSFQRSLLDAKETGAHAILNGPSHNLVDPLCFGPKQWTQDHPGDPQRDPTSENRRGSAEKKEQINMLRRAKKDMNNLDQAMDNLREKARALQQEVDDSSDEGWTILAELTEELNAINEEIDEKELKWMELAEIVEEAETDSV